ncbi:TonB-dependent receptor [Anaerovibrio sp.]|uniref:TonB-dependent receptor n=1 Tax=Anaerovibrio sp. TaxID=1872532 RepID=UPI00388E3F13
MGKKKWLALAVLTAITTGSMSGAYVSDTTDSDYEDVIVERARVDFAGGMVAREESVGLLGKKDVMETPFQVMTFDYEKTKVFNTSPDRSIMDIIRFSPSVRTSMGLDSGTAYIRGMGANGKSWFINGIPGVSHQKVMTSDFIDKVTVISGPAIGVRGTNAAWQENTGGIVDMQSKRASDAGDRNISIGFSGKSYFSQSIDFGERFGKNKEWGIRVNATHGEGKLAVDNAEMKQLDFYVNIDHRDAKSNTNLLIGYDETKQNGNGGNSLSIGNKVTAIPAAPDGSINFSPAWNEDEYSNWMFTFNHEQHFTDHLTGFIDAGRHVEDYSSWIQGYSKMLQNNAGDYYANSLTGYGSGFSQWPVYHVDEYFRIGVKGDFKTGDWKHDYVLSFDKHWFERRTVANYGTDSAPGLYIPAPGNIYTTNNVTTNYSFPRSRLSIQQKLNMTGWHVIDTITSPNERLFVTLGLHGHNGVRAQNYDGKTGMKIDAGSTCPTVAVAYKFDDHVTAYVNHSESFDEGSVVSNPKYKNYGESIDPSKTRQNEIGIKYYNAGMVQTFSLFNIKKQGINDVIGDDGFLYQKVDKQMHYNGMEYSAAGKIYGKLDGIFALSCLNIRNTDGTGALGLSKWAGNFGLIYKPDNNWSMIGRYNYASSARVRHASATANALDVPSYGTLDLGVVYNTKFNDNDLTLSLMCNNVFNKRYWYTNPGSGNLNLGMPRSITFNATLKF